MAEVEKILGATLPDSARKYDQYWRPTSQPHAKVWAELGWDATPDFEDMSVIFKKIE